MHGSTIILVLVVDDLAAVEGLLLLLFLVLANFAVLYRLVGTLQLLQSLLLPYEYLISQVLQLLKLIVLEGGSGERVALVVEQVLVDVDSVDNVARRQLDGVLHQLNKLTITVLIRLQRYFSGISPQIYSSSSPSTGVCSLLISSSNFSKVAMSVWCSLLARCSAFMKYYLLQCLLSFTMSLANFSEIYDNPSYYVQVDKNLHNVAQEMVLFELVLDDQLPVGHESGRLREGVQHVVEQAHDVAKEGLGEEGFRAPLGQLLDQLDIGGAVAHGGLNLTGNLVGISLLFLGQLSALGLVLQLLVDLVLLVGLVEAVGGVTDDHVQESLEHVSLEVGLKVVPVDLVSPQCHEDPIDALPVLELGVELMAGAGHGDVTVEFKQSVGEVPVAHRVGLEGLVHDAGLVLIQEEEDQLEVISTDVGIGENVLLTQDQAGEFKYLVHVPLADQGQIVLLEPEHTDMELVDGFDQVLGQVVDQLAGVVIASQPAVHQVVIVDSQPLRKHKQHQVEQLDRGVDQVLLHQHDVQQHCLSPDLGQLVLQQRPLGVVEGDLVLHLLQSLLLFHVLHKGVVSGDEPHVQNLPGEEEELRDGPKLNRLALRRHLFFVDFFILAQFRDTRVMHKVLGLDVLVLAVLSVEDRLAQVEQTHVQVHHEAVVGQVVIFGRLKPAAQLGPAKVAHNGRVVPLQEHFL